MVFLFNSQEPPSDRNVTLEFAVLFLSSSRITTIPKPKPPNHQELIQLNQHGLFSNKNQRTIQTKNRIRETSERGVMEDLPFLPPEESSTAWRLAAFLKSNLNGAKCRFRNKHERKQKHNGYTCVSIDSSYFLFATSCHFNICG